MYCFEGCVHCGLMGLIIRFGHYVGFWLRGVEEEEEEGGGGEEEVSCLSHQNSFALLSGLSYCML
jgi:hypothetical protein